MNFKAYLRPLIEYWWLILAAGSVAVITSFVVTFFQTPIYQTQTTLVVGRMLYEANPSSNDIYLGQQLATYYANIGNRGDLRYSTQEALGLQWLPQYTVEPLPNSQLLEIVVVDSNPARAQAVANELAHQLILRSPTSNQQQNSDRESFVNEQINYLEEKIRETQTEIADAEKTLSDAKSAQQIDDAQAEINALQEKLLQLQDNYAALISNTGEGAVNTLSVIEYAPLPTSPVGPNKLLTILMAGFVAVILASAAAYLLDFLDDTFKTSEEISSLLGLPVLSTISKIVNEDEVDKRIETSPLKLLVRRIKALLQSRNTLNQSELNNENDDVFIFSSIYPRSLASEEFRSLRLNLGFVSVDKPLKTILITSPSPAEGKSSIASNLAIVMAQGGKKVILLDVDFRKPKVNSHFFIPNNKGLCDILRGSLEVNDVMQPWKENLNIITTGVIPPNPVDLLSSQRMAQILEHLEQISDVVIVDGPPLIFPDTFALLSKVDGILLVFRYAYTRRGIAKKHLEQLARASAPMIGVVFNDTPIQRTDYYNKYNFYNLIE